MRCIVDRCCIESAVIIYLTNTLPIVYKSGRVLIINQRLNVMHLPRNPPKIEDILSDEGKSKDILSDEVGEYAKRFNERYLHWSEVRFRDTGGFDSDIVWARMKIVRMDNSATLTLGKTHHRYNIPDRMMRMLREFDTRATAGSFPDITDPHRRIYYSVSSLMEESIASSQMEGAMTTTRDAKAMLRNNIRPRDRSERMILNNYRAMMFVKEWTDRQLTPRFIREIHSIVTDGTLDDGYRGRFRDNDDVVVQDSLSGEVFHQPIPEEQIDPAIRELCDFINDGDDLLHPLIKGSILHYAIGFIHPFEDGNGRVARTLFYWYGLRSGYRMMEYLAMSRYIRDHKGRYE